MDVDLLYERLPAYCFMCGCFDHVGLGCHLYTGSAIEPDKAPYGSWLQAEIKWANRSNLRDRRFGLGTDDAFVAADVKRPLANGQPPSPTVGIGYCE